MEKMAIVRYCLCTALDEAAHTMSWGMMAGWSQSNLLNHLKAIMTAGISFLIGRPSLYEPA